MTEKEERVRKATKSLGDEGTDVTLEPCRGMCHHGDCRLSKAVTGMLDVPIAPDDRRAQYHHDMIVEAAFKHLCWENPA